MRTTLSSPLFALFIAALCLAISCSKPTDSTTPTDSKPTAGKPLAVVATTTMLGDLVHEIGGDDVQLQVIMKPGGDPHLYQPTPGDAKMIAKSNLVFMHGLKLEGWLNDLVRNAGGQAKVSIISKGISPLKDPSRTDYPDPHFWHDVSLWKVAAHNVRDALIEADPAHTTDYTSRTQAYVKQLDALHEQTRQDLATIPKEKRVLITSHDAFQYYGKAYGLEVVAVQGVSTESQAGAQDVARIVDLVQKRSIPSIFVESSVNPKLIEQISRETKAKIGGTLYSDSLAAKGSPASTFIGMIRDNTQQITKALGGTPSQP